MKKWWETCLVAFSMYSRIPVPQVAWNDENMKYAVCAFPLIGLVIGFLEWIWSAVAAHAAFSPSLRAAVLVVIPILVTGGIHLDGLLDTADAEASHLDRERRFEIMEDSCSGAFAIICCGAYLLLFFGVFSQLPHERMPQLLMVFLISRSLSGYALLKFDKAKESGLLKTFSDAAMNYRASRILTGFLAGAALVLILTAPGPGFAACIAAGLCFFIYRRRSYKIYGGITGDLAGAFLCLTELAMAFCLAVF